ncbi:MAG TPA: PGPGW domain-containing protein [Acidobacteriota bacterium]
MRLLKKSIRTVGGFALLGIGVIGGFIPVLQGWVFILAGLALLAVDYHWARRIKQWALAKFQRRRKPDPDRPPQ